jgi:drug/metabolite transporter (DMT)-like permease
MNARQQLIVAALLFSSGGTAIKACGLDGPTVAAARSAVAAAFLWFAAPHSRRGVGRDAAWVAVAYAACLALFATANKLTTAAHAIFLQSTSILWVLLLAPRLLGEPASRRDGLAIAAAALGLGLLTFGGQDASTTAPDPATGNLLALGSGVAWAAVGLGLRWLARVGANGDGHARAAAAPLLGNALAAATLAPFATWTGWTALDVAVVGWLGVAQIGLAYLALTSAASQVPALEASLLLLLEPVVSTALAALVHHESPSPPALLGAAILVAGLAAHATSSVPERAP